MSTVAAPPAKDTYTPLELFGIDRLLDEDERDIAATVRRFVETRLKPNVEDWFESATLPKELAKEFGELGVLGMHLQGHGCAGTNAVSYGLACLELEAGDSGFRSFVSVQGSLSMFSIYRYGSEDQKNEWLPRLAAGEAIGCFGLTEPDFGSNPAGMRTRARRDGSDWVLNGTKMWITNGNLADVATVWAQTDEGIRGFLVPTDTPWVHRQRDSQEVVAAGLGDLGVGARQRPPARLGAVAARRGSRCPAVLPLNEARFGIVFGSLGAARDSLETAIAYTQSRDVFDRPLSSYQLTQEKLANMTVELGRACCWPSTSAGSRTPRGSARADQPGQAQQCARVAGDRPGVPDPAGRQRYHPGVLTAAACQQPRIGADLRGHLRDAPAVDR